jgi:hypothetical protein
LLARKNFQQRYEVVAILEILEQIPDLPTDLE